MATFLRGARKGVSQVVRAASAVGTTQGAGPGTAVQLRTFAAEAAPSGGGRGGLVALLGLAGVGGGLYYAQQNGYLEAALGPPTALPTKVVKADYPAVRQAIVDVLEDDDYDDGSFGPVLVRLAWHSSGTYDKETKTGGSNGAGMRFAPESEYAANAGLNAARDRMELVKQKFPWISYADLWTLAGATAIEEMGGPHIPWRPGRSDFADASQCPPDNRLPDGAGDANHIRKIFYKMGFDDQEIVALSGAHALGRMHRNRSGWEGPWTFAPTTFGNHYYTTLLENKWRKKKWDGPETYEDKTGSLIMLPTDMWIIWDKKFKKYAQEYAKDDEKFFKDFAAAFSKLLELGVPYPETLPAAAGPEQQGGLSK